MTCLKVHLIALFCNVMAFQKIDVDPYPEVILKRSENVSIHFEANWNNATALKIHHTGSSSSSLGAFLLRDKCRFRPASPEIENAKYKVSCFACGYNSLRGKVEMFNSENIHNGTVFHFELSGDPNSDPNVNSTTIFVIDENYKSNINESFHSSMNTTDFIINGSTEKTILYTKKAGTTVSVSLSQLNTHLKPTSTEEEEYHGVEDDLRLPSIMILSVVAIILSVIVGILLFLKWKNFKRDDFRVDKKNPVNIKIVLQPVLLLLAFIIGGVITYTLCKIRTHCRGHLRKEKYSMETDNIEEEEEEEEDDEELQEDIEDTGSSRSESTDRNFGVWLHHFDEIGEYVNDCIAIEMEAERPYDGLEPENPEQTLMDWPYEEVDAIVEASMENTRLMVEENDLNSESSGVVDYSNVFVMDQYENCDHKVIFPED